MTSRASSPVLIGRSSELDRLLAALRRAGEPSVSDLASRERTRSSAILIGGEAGVGKTRLVRELGERAAREGAMVLLGGCVVLGDGALPYAPIAEALRGLARSMPADELDELLGAGRPELARLVPDLALMPVEGTPGQSADWAQARLFELLLGVLERLAARSPVVLIVEDLHWSDRSTRDFLTFLVRNLGDTPVVLVMSYRSDELHRRHPLLPFLAELGRGDVERMELTPFDRRDAAAQLRAIAGHDLDPGLIESIHARSAGNAFFAEELLMAAGDDGRAELPATLRDALLARIADLAEPTQDVLRVASAAGHRVDPSLVAQAAAIDDDTLYEALRESVGRQVLIPDTSAGGVERYAFRHALVQEAIYDDLLPGERIRLHSAFARTLEACCADDASHSAELAYHWYEAHDLPSALCWSVSAGTAAEAAYAFPEAASHYERAVELWDRVEDAEARAGRDRIDLLARLADVSRYHDPSRAVAHIQTAIGLVDEERDPVRSGLLHERLGRYAWSSGQGDLANTAYRTAVRLIPAEPASPARARALAGLAQILALGATYSASLVVAEEALALARAVGARDIEGHALNTIAMDRGIAGDLEGGFRDIREAIAIADEVGVVDDIGRGHANLVWLLDVAGRLEEAVEAAEAGVQVSEQRGLVRFFGSHLLCNKADCLYRLGRWDESEHAIRRAEAAGASGVNAILEQEVFGRLALARGRFDEAEERLRPLASLAERAADVQFVSPVQASLASLALWQGTPQAALDGLTAAIEQIDFTPEIRTGELYALGVRAAADAVELAIARRAAEDEQQPAVEAGQALLEGYRRRHAEVVDERPVFVAGSAAWLLLCEAEGTRLHRAPDPAAWARAAAAWADLGLPYPEAYARWREAEALLAARGDRHAAAAALRAALDVAHNLRAVPLEREVTALATRARIPLDEGEVAAADTPAPDLAAELGLTAREREVLEQIALGRTNRQIAEELFISQNTAGVHVSNILGKLGVSSRGEAAAVAYRLGLVEPVEASDR